MKRQTWHGIKFTAPISEDAACLHAFSDYEEVSARGWKLTKPDTFWRIADLWWPYEKKGKIAVTRNPWSERMIEEACRWKLLAASGCASCGKSFLLGGAWGLVNWACDPANTIVLVTSTTLQGSRMRVWKDIRRLFQGCRGVGMDSLNPAFKLLDAVGQIKIDARELGKQTDTLGHVVAGAGIEIVAGEPSKTAEASAKLQGIKSKRVILIGDEFPHLGHGILETALGNLMSNAHFQLIALGNFKSIYDPFGVFVEPADGWRSINEDSDGWLTVHGGYCMRFDGEQSPNVIAGYNAYPGLYSCELHAQHLRMGRKSAAYWQMCRALPLPEGGELSIYSEADFVNGGVHDGVIWDSTPTMMAFLDPAFTNGGDRSQLVIAAVGKVEGKPRLKYEKEFVLTSDVTKLDMPHDFQIVHHFMRLCQEHGVKPEHAGFDDTGAGISFGAIVHKEWSHRVLGVSFGGAASEMPVSLTEDETCRDRYHNRVSELWVQGREYVRGGQIKGMSRAMASELLARHFPDPKITKVSYKKIKVEGKDEMKSRIGFSPDLGDAGLGVIEVARQRLDFVAGGYGRAMVDKQDEESELLKTTYRVLSEDAVLKEDEPLDMEMAEE